jgi:hypothetical protein
MPRITTVKKARKAQGNCGRCGKAIEVGDSYRWWKFRYGGRSIRCLDVGCAPRASELTQSKMSTVYAAQESLADFLAKWDGTDLDEVQQEVECCADEVEEVADEYQEAADNQREHFPDSETADENEERAEQLREWADEIRDAAQNLEPLAGDDDEDEPNDDDAPDADEWRANVITEIESALENCPL